jgi:hypothetical protein
MNSSHFYSIIFDSQNEGLTQVQYQVNFDDWKSNNILSELTDAFDHANPISCAKRPNKKRTSELKKDREEECKVPKFAALRLRHFASCM